MSGGGRPADPAPPGATLPPSRGGPAGFHLQLQSSVSCPKLRLSSVDTIAVSGSCGLVTAGRAFRLKPRTCDRVRALAPGVKALVQHVGPGADVSAESSAPRWHEEPR